ncbi:MAG TPA: GlsB/YeaQ/YmgE family stress response membrane protein [Balneolales bacterium]|nr:GlsB/YeaQ/YmgE family stress response membrane protein [Balneolales bacterium]
MGGLIAFVIIGIISGWLAGKLTKGKGFGLAGDLVVGVIGALLGGFIFSIFGFHAFSIIGKIITSVVGAVIFLYIIRQFK